MLKRISLVLAALVVVLLVVIATRPDTYHVERSLDVDAPATVIFSSVGDLRAFGEWSPWDKRDPVMRKTFSEPSAGVGASYAWEGNKEVGKGNMTIIESRPPEHVAERLEFIEPFASVAQTAIDLKPAGANVTRVTWSMDGKSNLVGKAFSLVMNMDKMVGKDFEAGLASLKRVAEAKKPAVIAEPTPPPAPGLGAAPGAPKTH